MSDNLTKGRITKVKNQITALGLPVPVLQDDLSLSEQEAVLREYLSNNKTSGESDIANLRRLADIRGVEWNDETSEEALSLAIEEFDDRMKAKSNSEMEARQQASALGLDSVAEIAKQIGKEVGSAIAEANARSNKPKGEERILTEREYDPNDLTESKTYFAPMVYYKLPMKRVGGVALAPPFGKIEFKLLDGSSVRTGTQNQTRYICSYTTNSKREQAYIETHNRFGREFYLSDSKARLMGDDHRYALKFGERMNMLRTYQAPALYKIAADMNLSIDVNMGLDAIRDLIAGEQAKSDVAAEKAHRQSLIEASERELLLRKAQQQ